MSIGKVAASITAQNTGTDGLSIQNRKFNISLRGFTTTTVTLQRSFDSGVTWRDVKVYTAPDEQVGEEPGTSKDANGLQWRLFVKNGDFGDGPALLELNY